MLIKTSKVDGRLGSPSIYNILIPSRENICVLIAERVDIRPNPFVGAHKGQIITAAPFDFAQEFAGNINRARFVPHGSYSQVRIIARMRQEIENICL